MKRNSSLLFLRFVACNLFLVTIGFSAESPGTAQATVAPYQDTSPQYNESTSRTPFLSSSPLSGFDHSGSLIPEGPIYPSATRTPRISFPAVPPVLGDPLPPPRFGFARREDLEAQLSPYANELFYAPLSGLFYEEDFSRKRRRKLEAFRTLQAELLAELRARIESVRDAANDLRHEEFARLAARQAPRLAELEAQSESLRSDFVHGGFFSIGIKWNDTRDWRLGDDLMFESRHDEARVMRAAAFFEEGLSDGQRQLLRELAIELSEPIGQPTAGLELDQPKPAIFFSPSTARIRLPNQIPLDLAEKIEAYTAAKGALKNELRELIYAQDNAWLNRLRIRAIRELAQKQASRIAELDMMAEEIRERLVLLPSAFSKNEGELPAELGERIRHYFARKQSVENAYVEKLGQLRSAYAQARFEFDRSTGAPAISYTASRSTAKKAPAQLVAIRNDLSAFNHQHIASLRDLEKEREAIQNEMAGFLRRKHPVLDLLPVDLVIHEYGKVSQWQLNWLRYTDYETAVLEPGLSPAQRRLLFGAALEKLRLPPTP